MKTLDETALEILKTLLPLQNRLDVKDSNEIVDLSNQMAKRLKDNIYLQGNLNINLPKPSFGIINNYTTVYLGKDKYDLLNHIEIHLKNIIESMKYNEEQRVSCFIVGLSQVLDNILNFKDGL